MNEPSPWLLEGPENPPLQALAQPAHDPFCALLLAHGAGAGMRHPHLARLSSLLSERGVTVVRYEFPYMSESRRRPDPPARLEGTVRAAARAVAARLPGLPLFAGGRSMGGRMTTRAAATSLAGVSGLVLFAFPLHPPKRPGTSRAEHLSQVTLPMLFLQGTRDTLADLELLRPVLQPLGAHARLHVVDGADHSFQVLKRSGRTRDDVEAELADTTVAWMRGVLDEVAR